MANTTVMKAPSGFTGTVSCTGGVPPLSGQSYTPDADGVVAVDPVDTTAMLRAGFSLLPAGSGAALSTSNTAITTAGAGVLTAAGIVGGLITRSGSTAAYSDTTATAALILAAMLDPAVGNSWELIIKNTVPFAQTLIGGADVTLGGQTIIPGNSVGRFLVTVSAATTISILGIEISPLTLKAPEVATALATVGAGTITAAGIAGGITARSGSQSGTAFTDTTATAALIIAAQPNANIGESWTWAYQNNTNAEATLTGGVGVTVSGITKVPKNSVTQFLVTYTAAATVTIVGIATASVAPQATQSAVATADDGTTQTLTAAMITGANDVNHVSTGGATPGLTLPLGSAMDTALPNMQIGQSYKLRIINRNSGSATVITNTGWTLTGTLTLATNTTRDFVVTKTGTATYTGVAVGTGADS